MVRHGFSADDLARTIGKSQATIYNKLNGSSDFLFSEALEIRDRLFPGINIEYLFETPSQAFSQAFSSKLISNGFEKEIRR